MNFVPSGVDFGWRNGTGKWPVHYADTLPPVVNIGPGSPTGVTFGYGQVPVEVPGRVVHLRLELRQALRHPPEAGRAGYTAEKEEFVAAARCR